jgi:hypothetical protein
MLFLSTVLLSPVIVFSEESCLLQRGASRTSTVIASTQSTEDPEWMTISRAGLFCRDTESYFGWSTGSEDCKAKCKSDSTCNFYSIWKSNFCRLTASCSDQGPDGDQEIRIYSKPQKDPQTSDLSLAGQSPDASIPSFPGVDKEIKDVMVNGQLPDDNFLKGFTDWTSTRWDRNGQDCRPTCTYTCEKEQPICEQDCEPVCKQPNCTTDCEDAKDLAWLQKCTTVCGKPVCKVVCEGCPDNNECPGCRTVCADPICTTQCPERACKTQCDAPHCEWKCNAPKDCPDPKCKFCCETPQSKVSSSEMSFLQLPETARVPIRVRTVFEPWPQPLMKHP